MSLADIETYYDSVARPVAATEEVGPFTLFLAEPGTGWQFYARPRLGVDHDFTADDVRRVLDRQAELGVPRAVEWVDEVTPSLLPAVRAAVTGSHELELCPLLVLPTGADLGVPSRRTRLLAPDDPDLSDVVGAISAGFDESDQVAAGRPGRRPELIERGLLVMVAAYDAHGTVVGGGSAAPRGDAAELMGIAVVVTARRQGLGAATTSALVSACRAVGVRSILLSSGSDQATSIYRRLGFEPVGTACVLGVTD
jgi:GNAT superfamily N-acetyltransferase